jgi:hypothetical protein
MIMDLPRTANPETEQNSSSQQTIRFRAAGKGALNVPDENTCGLFILGAAEKAVDNPAAAG